MGEAELTAAGYARGGSSKAGGHPGSGYTGPCGREAAHPNDSSLGWGVGAGLDVAAGWNWADRDGGWLGSPRSRGRSGRVSSRFGLPQLAQVPEPQEYPETRDTATPLEGNLDDVDTEAILSGLERDSPEAVPTMLPSRRSRCGADVARQFTDL